MNALDDKFWVRRDVVPIATAYADPAAQQPAPPRSDPAVQATAYELLQSTVHHKFSPAVPLT